MRMVLLVINQTEKKIFGFIEWCCRHRLGYIILFIRTGYVLGRFTFIGLKCIDVLIILCCALLYAILIV